MLSRPTTIKQLVNRTKFMLGKSVAAVIPIIICPHQLADAFAISERKYEKPSTLMDAAEIAHHFACLIINNRDLGTLLRRFYCSHFVSPKHWQGKVTAAHTVKEQGNAALTAFFDLPDQAPKRLAHPPVVFLVHRWQPCFYEVQATFRTALLSRHIP